MKVVLFGAGYVGCVTAACFSSKGHDLVVIDIDENKVSTLNRGNSPIVEPGLQDLIREQVNSERLTASMDVGNHLDDTDIVLICVPTPSRQDGSVDETALIRVFQTIIEKVKNRESALTVVIRSTIPGLVVKDLLRKFKADDLEKLWIATNPEFLRETTSIEDFYNPPYIIIGSDDEKAVEKLELLYESIDAPIKVLDLNSASIVKYASNAFHAAKISFANEISTVAEIMEADPLRVMKVLTEDTVLNVSPAYLKPGFAFGGSCLPKDVRALIEIGNQNNEYLPLMNSLIATNERRIHQAFEIIENQVEGKKLAFIGLSFKKGSDDLRESPYVTLADMLTDKDYEIKIFDPDLQSALLIGSNLNYINKYVPQLTTLLIDNISDVLSEANGVVYCKNLMTEAEILSLIGKEIPVIDLEYRLTGFRKQGFNIFTLGNQS